MDVMERTLAQEKGRFDKFCRIMHVISTLLWILFMIGAVFCLIVPIVQAVQYRNNGGAVRMTETLVSVLYVFLVLGGIGLLWNSARHIFRRLRTAETPFCYDIADKIILRKIGRFCGSGLYIYLFCDYPGCGIDDDSLCIQLRLQAAAGIGRDAMKAVSI